MSFNVLSIRTGDEVDDGALYPLVSDVSQVGLIALDGYDGVSVTTVVATAVRIMEIGETTKTLMRLRDVKIDVYITDSRVAMACEKYDKGGGWVGFGGAGVLVAVTANAVSKARAASRSRGKVLVGHVRYPWVKAVGATAKTGFTSNEAIRVEFTEKRAGATVRKLVELTLPKNIDATLVAQEIARRVAAFRLASQPETNQETQARFAALRDPAQLRPDPGRFAFYQMPTFFHVSAATAFPRPVTSPAPPDGQRPQRPPEGLVPPPRLAIPGAPVARSASVPAVADPAVADGPVFCTHCGTRSVAGDSFCGQCGAVLSKVTQ